MQGIRESAGWGPASWLPKSNFVEFKDTNRSPSFSGNWRRWSPLSRRLSNGERHRRVGYARAATFHGVSGDSHDVREDPFPRRARACRISLSPMKRESILSSFRFDSNNGDVSPIDTVPTVPADFKERNALADIVASLEFLQHALS